MITHLKGSGVIWIPYPDWKDTFIGYPWGRKDPMIISLTEAELSGFIIYEDDGINTPSTAETKTYPIPMLKSIPDAMDIDSNCFSPKQSKETTKEIYGNLVGKEIKHQPMPKSDELPKRSKPRSAMGKTIHPHSKEAQKAKEMHGDLAEKDDMITIQVPVGSYIIPPQYVGYIPRSLIKSIEEITSTGLGEPIPPEESKPTKEEKIDKFLRAFKSYMNSSTNWPIEMVRESLMDLL